MPEYFSSGRANTQVNPVVGLPFRISTNLKHSAVMLPPSTASSLDTSLFRSHHHPVSLECRHSCLDTVAAPRNFRSRIFSICGINPTQPNSSGTYHHILPVVLMYTGAAVSAVTSTHFLPHSYVWEILACRARTWRSGHARMWSGSLFFFAPIVN